MSDPCQPSVVRRLIKDNSTGLYDVRWITQTYFEQGITFSVSRLELKGRMLLRRSSAKQYGIETEVASESL